MQTEAHCDEHNLDFITENLCPACIKQHCRETERSAGSESRSSEWVEELEAELRRAQERTKHEADFAHYREASYWAGVRDTYERIIASWRGRSSNKQL